MSTMPTKSKQFIAVLSLLCGIGATNNAIACGGFFCDFVPIDQAGEQIVFKQVGDQTTAMIKIDYVGNAEDFGWVLPVPQVPEISLGSDLTFTELELNTRPQFLLEREGEVCFNDLIFSSAGGVMQSTPVSAESDSAAKTGVTVEKQVSVGPFDAQVVSSDDPQALATWLADNNLDLTDQGSELLAPYINSGSKFVVLKLKNDANVGSIQPIILEYQSSAPVIPMTLTAVAAQDDMGVLVWLLGEGRGVPKNFKHVIPNYTRLNWFRGTRAAYISYQNLITEAMDEAGGQGFATDFAGYLPNLVEQLTNAERWEGILEEASELSDAGFVSFLWQNIADNSVQQAIRSSLPTSDSFVYAQPLVLEELFSTAQLQSARSVITQTVQEQLIDPTNNAIGMFDDNLYLTRLYTTLSADEMDANPEFTFNTEMENQTLTRNATLSAECINEETHWTLKLGEGTGRDDEVVIEGQNIGIPIGPVVTSSDQAASWQIENTSATNDPVIVAKNSFEVAVLTSNMTNSSSSSSSSSSSGSSSSSSSSGNLNNPEPSVTTKSGKSKSGAFNGLTLLMLSTFLFALRGRNFYKK